MTIRSPVTRAVTERFSQKVSKITPVLFQNIVKDFCTRTEQTMIANCNGIEYYRENDLIGVSIQINNKTKNFTLRYLKEIQIRQRSLTKSINRSN